MEKKVKVFNKNFLLLWQGQLVSQIGSQVFNIALVFWIKHTYDSASLISLVTIVSYLPVILFGTFAGVFADRYSRKSIIILTDLLNGLIVLILGIGVFYLPDSIILILIIFVSCVVSTLTAFFTPAVSAVIPDLVNVENLTTANSFQEFAKQFATFVGQGIGGVLFRVFGTAVLFIINGVSFLLSALSESFIQIPKISKQENLSETEQTETKNMKRELIESFTYVKKHKGLKIMCIVMMSLNFCFMPFITLLSYYVENTLGLTTDWYGYFIAGFGVGAILSYVFVSTVKLQQKSRMIVMLIALFGQAFILIALGFVRNPWVGILVAIMAGAVNGVLNILNTSLLQIAVPREMRGRVFGLVNTLSTAMTPIAMGLAGIAADLTNKNISLIVIICGILAMVVSIYAASRKEFRNFLKCDLG